MKKALLITVLMVAAMSWTMTVEAQCFMHSGAPGGGPGWRADFEQGRWLKPRCPDHGRRRPRKDVEPILIVDDDPVAREGVGCEVTLDGREVEGLVAGAEAVARAVERGNGDEDERGQAPDRPGPRSRRVVARRHQR